MSTLPRDQQILELRRRFDRDPRSGVFVDLAEALLAAGRTVEAAEVCHKGLLSNPTHVRGHLMLASAYREEGRWQDARNELHRVVKLDPTYSPARRLLGEVLLALGDENRAAVELQVALDLAPDDAAARDLLRRLQGAVDGEETEDGTNSTRPFPLSALQAIRVATPSEPVSAAALSAAATDPVERRAEAAAAAQAADDDSEDDGGGAGAGAGAGAGDATLVSIDLPPMRPDDAWDEIPSPFPGLPALTPTGFTAAPTAPPRGTPALRPVAKPLADDAESGAIVLPPPDVPVRSAGVPALGGAHGATGDATRGARPEGPAAADAGPAGGKPRSEDADSYESFEDDATPTDMDPEIRMKVLGELWRAKLAGRRPTGTMSVSVPILPRADRRESTESLAVRPGALAETHSSIPQGSTGSTGSAGVQPLLSRAEAPFRAAPPGAYSGSVRTSLAAIPSQAPSGATRRLGEDDETPHGDGAPLGDDAETPLAGDADVDEDDRSGALPTVIVRADVLAEARHEAPFDDLKTYPPSPPEHEAALESFSAEIVNDDPSPGAGNRHEPASDHGPGDLDVTHPELERTRGGPREVARTTSRPPPELAPPRVPSFSLDAAPAPVPAPRPSAPPARLAVAPAGTLDGDGELPTGDYSAGEDAVTNESAPVPRADPWGHGGRAAPGPVTALSDPEPSSDHLLAPRRQGSPRGRAGAIPATALEVPVPAGRRSSPVPDPVDEEPGDATTHVRDKGPRAPALFDGLSSILDLPERHGQPAALDELQLSSHAQPMRPSRAGPDPLDEVLRSRAMGELSPLAPDRIEARFRWGWLFAGASAAVAAAVFSLLLYLNYRARERDGSVRETLTLATEAAEPDTWTGYLDALDLVQSLDVSHEEYPELPAREAFLHAAMVVRFGLEDLDPARDALSRVAPDAAPSADYTFAAAVVNGWGGPRTRAEAGLLDVDSAMDAFDHPALPYLRGELLVLLDDEKHARSAFQAALDLHASYVPALVALGLLDAARGDDAGADRRLTEALAVSPKHAAALVARFRVLEHRGSDARGVAAALRDLLGGEEAIAPRDRRWATFCIARSHRAAGAIPETDALLAELEREAFRDLVLSRELAALLLSLDRPAAAEEVLERALGPDLAESERAPLVNLQAFAAFERGDPAAALARLAKLADAREPIALYLRGRAELATGALDRAEADLRAALADEPKLLVAALALGRALVAAKRPKEAVDVLSVALREPDGKVARGTAAARALDPIRWLPPGSLLATLGRAHLMAGNLRAALTSLEAALERNEADADAHLDIARLYKAPKDAPAKERHLGRALELRPDFPAARLERGLLRATRGRYRDALADLGPALEKDRTDRKLIEPLLEAALSEGDAPGAADGLKLLFGAGLGEVKKAIWWARVELCAGRGGEARRIAEKTLPLAPRDAGLLTILGEVAMMGGDPTAARKSFEAALSSDRGHLRALLGLGEARLALGDEGRAAEAFQAVRARAASGAIPYRYAARALLGLARVEIDRREPARALGYASEAATLAPAWKDALVLRAKLAIDAKKPEVALGAWRAAVAADPRDPELRFSLAESLRFSGEPKAALAEYRAYLDLAPAGRLRASAERWVATLDGK